MADYDGLTLNTPTLIRSDAETEVWATRTATGGMVEHRFKPGSLSAALVANEGSLNAEVLTSFANIRSIANSTGTLTGLQLSTAVRALARAVIVLGRLVIRRLDATD